MEDKPKAACNAAPWNSCLDVMEPLPASGKVVLTGENPFVGLRISDTTGLDGIEDRGYCSRCGKSRKYFCYECCMALPATKGIIPELRIRLPCKIDIIKHAREIDGKSTATHAKLICPRDVDIYTYPDFPDYGALSEDERLFLVFPSQSAKTLDDVLVEMEASNRERSESERAVGVRVVFIDSTWSQTKSIYNALKPLGLTEVRIDDRDTVFWRYQRGLSTKHLATIEAIYYFLVDFATKVRGNRYEGDFDDLLFFYKFMYEKIHRLYDRSRLRSYNRRDNA